MSAQTNHLNDSEEEELGALIYKSSKTAKKFLLEASGASQHSKKRVAPPSDDCPVRKEGGKLIHESSFRYSPRSASKKLKVGETTDGSSKCTGDNIMSQQKQSQASEFKWASSELGSDNEDDSSDNEYPAEPSSYIASYTAGRRYNLRRASRRQASNEATEPEPELISSAASTTPPSLSPMYCAVINEDGKSAEEIEGTYTDIKGREFVIKQIAGKKYKHYCKPEGVIKKDPQAILLCKHPGCTNASCRGGVCVKHGAKRKCCKVEGCTSQRVANHLCFKHGGKTICKHNGCTNIAKGQGVCTRHVSTIVYMILRSTSLDPL